MVAAREHSRGMIATREHLRRRVADLARDGDHLTKDERYARTDEYLQIMRLEWTSERPFDFA